MKMMQMKLTRVAELTQMQTDQNQHLSYYEINTVTKLRKVLCDVGGSSVYVLLSLVNKETASFSQHSVLSTPPLIRQQLR